jgi:pyridinium-3,5-bisthiocarboxylic acid mononucleotide nickel chelatase
MRVVYVHGFAGVSDTGLLAALLAAGAPLAAVEDGWRGLQLPPVEVVIDRVQLPEYIATRLTYSAQHVETFLAQHTFTSLTTLIEQSPVPVRVRQRFVQLVSRLADTVAALHGSRDKDLALRSAGMPAVLYMGSGVALALEALAVDQLLSAPVNLGRAPAPLVVELLRGVPVYGDNGAAVECSVVVAATLAALAEHFGPLPSMTIAQTGYGVLTAQAGDTPQGLQVLLGEMAGSSAAERIAVIETNIDDMNPEFYEVILERLLAQGALDVTLTPLLMKKSRPAHKLSVLAPLFAVPQLSRLILRETSTFGVRVYEVWRQKLERFSRQVETCYGPVPVKCGVLDDKIVQAAPEYEACKRAALGHGVPVRLVYTEAARLAALWLL